MNQQVKKTRVLFVCPGNSCRRHMAAGFLRASGGEPFAVLSAGAKPAGYVHPLAIAAMHDIGVDISSHRSKSLDAFAGREFDYVITVCDRAREARPVFPGAVKQLHWSFDDPAHAEGSNEPKMAVFRRVREEIRRRIQLFVLMERRDG